jgi:hypothetical protein
MLGGDRLAWEEPPFLIDRAGGMDMVFLREEKGDKHLPTFSRKTLNG